MIWRSPCFRYETFSVVNCGILGVLPRECEPSLTRGRRPDHCDFRGSPRPLGRAWPGKICLDSVHVMCYPSRASPTSAAIPAEAGTHLSAALASESPHSPEFILGCATRGVVGDEEHGRRNDRDALRCFGCEPVDSPLIFGCFSADTSLLSRLLIALPNRPFC